MIYIILNLLLLAIGTYATALVFNQAVGKCSMEESIIKAWVVSLVSVIIGVLLTLGMVYIVYH